MAAPNLFGSSTATGKTAVELLTTATSNVVTNSAASNTVAKIENITLTNYSGSVVSANVVFNRGGTSYFVGGNITIPVNSILTVVGKDTSFYLEEGDVLQANVSANTAISITVGYELIAS